MQQSWPLICVCKKRKKKKSFNMKLCECKFTYFQKIQSSQQPFSFSKLSLLGNGLKRDDIFVESRHHGFSTSSGLWPCFVGHKFLMNSCEFDHGILLCRSNDHLSVYQFFSHELICMSVQWTTHVASNWCLVKMNLYTIEWQTDLRMTIPRCVVRMKPTASAKRLYVCKVLSLPAAIVH